jgi:hypothetical protein
MRSAAVLLACSLAAPAIANSDAFDGRYFPQGAQGWDCTSIGMDGGALAVQGGHLYGVESKCKISMPVSVRGMDATLFDLQCSAEGEDYSERVLMGHSEDGIVIVRNLGNVAFLTRCPEL